MKVLVVNWRDITNPEAGGAEIHIDEILKRKPSDWEVDFVSASYPGCTPTLRTEHYTIIRIPNNSLFNLSFRSYYQKTLRHKGYDLIIDDVSKIPLCISRYAPDTPVLAIHHHVHGKSLFKQLSWPMAFYVYHMEKFLLRYYKDIPLISVSESSKQDLLSLYDFKNIIISHNGIDFKSLSQNTHARKEAYSLIYLGRLKKYKRVDHIIHAVSRLKAKLPDIRFHITGKGDDEARLQLLVQELGLEQEVIFHGFINDDQKATLLQSCSLFVIASEKEGWGISVLEANAAGLPALAYSVEGLRDSIQHGKTGILVANDDLDAFSASLEDLLRDKKKLAGLAKNAVQYAAGFSWEKTAEDFYRIAADVIKDFKK